MLQWGRLSFYSRRALPTMHWTRRFGFIPAVVF